MTDYEKAMTRAKAWELAVMYNRDRFDGRAEKWQIRDDADYIYLWLTATAK